MLILSSNSIEVVFIFLLLLLFLKHPVCFQLTMTPSGRQRGAGVRQTAQKPSSRAHWMIW